ncbi:hypothetical protein [Paenibacillus sp.]|jgi:hypothetical protein|nr:hypothetical protein [Paenibacillus sp.]
MENNALIDAMEGYFQAITRVGPGLAGSVLSSDFVYLWTDEI